jgi:tetratricopeptide (TPR) repeat protein
MIGRRLSHYDILDEISRGGMGVVYRARDINLGREVALKVLPEMFAHDAERRERLLQEARAASAIEHPNIAVIHEVGEADDLVFVAMELIRGEQLSAVLATGPQSLGRAIALATQIAEGLARAHEKGIVHRDLKPGNVIVTEDGHAKIIDFGLAKYQPQAGSGDATTAVRAPQTDAGIVFGTAGYMSPEQVRGVRIDLRTDVFALGVTLYEMVTGRPAFQGRSALDTMNAVLTLPVPPLPALGGSLPEATAAVQRIIEKCTAKEPDDRFQGMRDLIVDLRAAARKLESGQTSADAPAPVGGAVSTPSRTRRYVAVAVTVAAIAMVALAWWGSRRSTPPASRSGKPAIAVLYFENNTGDASLDWMRTGLTDMMVTDLSQSTEFEVLGTDRLVEILEGLKRTEDRTISAEVVSEIARRAAVDTVVVGGYVKAGDTFRINVRLQEATSGRILKSERVEGNGASSVLALVDELTRRVRSTMAGQVQTSAELLSKPNGTSLDEGLDRRLSDVTSSSIEAYRYYAEGINLHERGMFAQARTLLERAVAIDPTFAMAHAKLAVVNGNVNNTHARNEHAKRALELSARLTSRERYYIEGYYYGLNSETIGRSIEAYQQALRLHPEHQASRHNLAQTFSDLERFAEAVPEYEELLRRQTESPTTYEGLAGALVQMGNISRARDVADGYVRRYPESAGGWLTLGLALIAAGRLDEARAAYEKAESLDPLEVFARIGKRSVAMLQARWTDAETVNAVLSRSPAAWEQYVALNGAGHVALAHGRGQEALELWERSIRTPAIAPLQVAGARGRQARLLLRMRRPAQALIHAEGAARAAKDTEVEFEALEILAVAQAAAKRPTEAAKTVGLIEARAKALPGNREMRRLHSTRGAIALEVNDIGRAVAELTAAQKLLPVNGPVIGPPMTYLDILLDLATALIKAGRDADAAQVLERLQAGHERSYAIEPYMRSFFLLGQIYERQGNAKARDQYARFLEYWRDGDLERGWVADAERKLKP